LRDWQALRTANIRFHEAIMILADSERITDPMGVVHAEARLVFHFIEDRLSFHERYFVRNREICLL